MPTSVTAALYGSVVVVHLVYGTEESDLLTAIFTNYRPDIRPKPDSSYVTNVTIYLSLFSLLSVNEQMQTVRFAMDVTMQWVDPMLVWTPSAGSGLTTLKVPEGNIWTPDATFYAATSKADLISYDQRMVVLYNNGSITKSGPQIITHPCDIDIAHFPYDIQTCKLSIGSWSFSTDSMQLFTPFESYQPSDEFTGNSEWELLSFTSAAALDTSYEEADFGMVVFAVQLRRTSQFYTMAVIMPTFVCMFLCFNGLFLPGEISGLNVEKVSLGVCTLLAMSLILESVTATMPKSEKLPLLVSLTPIFKKRFLPVPKSTKSCSLCCTYKRRFQTYGIYVLAETILCAIAVLVTCIFLLIHERASTRGWIPPSRIVSTFLTRRYDRKITHVDASQQDHSRSTSTEFTPYLQKISSFLQDAASDRRLQRMWGRIFDRLSILALLFFQLANIIMTMAILL